MLEKGFATMIKRLTRFTRAAVMVAFVFYLSGPAMALAQEAPAATQNVDAVAQAAGVTAPTDIFTIIGRIINIALGFVGIILLGLLLYAGFLWMTSGGAEEQIKKAKLYIRNAIIGLIIIASAFAIVNFILSQLAGVTSGGGGITGAGGPGVGFPNAAGSLGGGIIEYHVPQRDATGVPRNTAIIITFKEPIKISSIVKDYDDNGTPADLSDDSTSTTTTGLNSDAIKIYPTASSNQALATNQARVRFTSDRKTFVIKPLALLGSPTVNVPYTVELLPGKTGILRENGTPAFTGAFSSGYKWSFEVSTVIDTTPPQISSVIPSAGGQYAPNIVVQMNFNEPIDPTSASGIFKNGSGFTNMEVSATPIKGGQTTRPNGEFKISNGYTTVEFVTDLPCGINSCGRQIFCLPYNASIAALIKAATLSNDPPQAELTNSGYDGITDVAGNSFDGNGDSKAQGPATDNYSWSFGTTDQPNLTPPHVQSTEPPAGDHQNSSNIPLDQQPQANFDTVLQASTLVSDNVFIRTNETAQLADTFWWTPRQTLLNGGGAVATSGEMVVAGRVSINHRIYLPAATSTQTPEYDPFLLSGVQNVYQNCFNPSSSGVCKGTPNCCDDKSSLGICDFPPQ